MAQADVVYHGLCKDILDNGVKKSDRTGTGTISVFGRQLRFDMRDGKFPLLTTKKMYTKGIIYELFWFLGHHMKDEKYKKLGLTNIKYLVDNNVNIWVGDTYKDYCKKFVAPKPPSTIDVQPEWYNPLSEKEFIYKIKTDDEYAMRLGNLGPVYGKQWTNWGYEIMNDDTGNIMYNSINQIQQAIDMLKTNPDSRRILVTAWNPSEINDCVLPPCHYAFQFYTRELELFERFKLTEEFKDKTDVDVLEYINTNIQNIDGFVGILHKELDKDIVPKRALSLMFNMRSIDVPLGLNFNIASYALLLTMMAKTVNMVTEDLIFNGADCHIYLNQIEGIQEQLKCSPNAFESPSCIIDNESNDIWSFSPDDIHISNYDSFPAIKMPLSN